MQAGILLSVALTMSILAKADFSTPASAQIPNYALITPKMNLDWAIQALKSGDSQGALGHLYEAFIVSSDQTAREHIAEGIRAIKANDSQGALMHLDAADKAISGGG